MGIGDKLRHMKSTISMVLCTVLLTSGCASAIIDNPDIIHGGSVNETLNKEVPIHIAGSEPISSDTSFATTGVTEIGGTLSVSNNTFTIAGQEFSTTTIKIEPTIRYFFRDDFSVSSSVLVNLETKSEGQGQNTTTTTGLMTGLTYFITVHPDLLYIGPGVQIGLVKTSTETGETSIDLSGFLLAGDVTAKLQLGTSAILSLGVGFGHQGLDIAIEGRAISGKLSGMNIMSGVSAFF